MHSFYERNDHQGYSMYLTRFCQWRQSNRRETAKERENNTMCLNLVQGILFHEQLFRHDGYVRM